MKPLKLFAVLQSLLIANASFAASTTEVWVGSPANGKWPSACSEKSYFPTNRCSLPPFHWDLESGTGNQDDGDWSVDLRFPGKTALYLFVAPQNVSDTITAKVESVREACQSGKGAKAVRIGIYHGSAKIGQLIYAHVVPDAKVKAGASISRWGGAIGTVADGLPKNDTCWTNPHVHFEAYNVAGYSCYNKGYGPDASISSTNFLGFLGGSRAKAPRTACP